MFHLLSDNFHFNFRTTDLWYAVPLIVAISLVYAATRHEQIRPILKHAGRVAFLITGFMLAILVVIEIISQFT